MILKKKKKSEIVVMVHDTPCKMCGGNPVATDCLKCPNI